MKRLLTFAFLIPCVLYGQNFNGGFHFYLPPNDSIATRFLPDYPARPIEDFIGIDAQGHFQANGSPLRFWGFNLTSGACFPLKDKARFIAARMRKMGINIVRFHHMDNPWTGQNGTILDRGFQDTRHLHAVSMDRFHYLMAALKRNGIYANINLHVTRTFTEDDGILHADSIADSGKAVTMFDEELIDLQKEYARNLLTAENPYTGLALVDDPVMGMVEITNENTVYGFWKQDDLVHYGEGGMLMQRHCDTLDKKWTAFLQSKYPDQDALEAAWGEGTGGAGRNDQIVNGGFESGDWEDGWWLGLHTDATAQVSLDSTNAYEGRYSAKVEVTRVTGTGWHIQFSQSDLSTETGKSYSVRFAMRASGDFEIDAYVMRDNSPYTWYDGMTVVLDTEWKEYEFIFSPPENNQGQVRLEFSFNNQVGEFWFDDVSFSEPEIRGVEQGENIAQGTVKRILFTERYNYSPSRVADMAEFYIGLQKDYYNEMYTYLKEDLGVKVPITGSNALPGLADVYSMSDLDYIDDHNYWDHPYYPGGWSETEWYIENTPLVNDWELWSVKELFKGLAIRGKPYTISEYRHSFPNRYEIEMMPLLSSYASFHDADALMFFEYNYLHDDWENDLVDGFFSMHAHNAQMALSPVYSYVYRNRLIQRDIQPINLEYSSDAIYEMAVSDRYGRWGKFTPYSSRWALQRSVRSSFNGTGEPDWNILPDEPELEIVDNRTHELIADVERGIFKTVTPEFASVTGFLSQPLVVQAGPLEILGSNEFGTVSWLSLDDLPLSETHKSLLTIASRLQNSNMIWDGITSVHNQWGTAPTEIFPLQVALILKSEADSIHLYPLDARGVEGDFISYQPVSPGIYLVTLNQSELQTLWFGLEAFFGPVDTKNPVERIWEIQLYPNPASDKILISGTVPEATTITVSILDLAGKQVQKSLVRNNTDALYHWIDVSTLSAGHYFFRITSGKETSVHKVIIN